MHVRYLYSRSFCRRELDKIALFGYLLPGPVVGLISLCDFATVKNSSSSGDKNMHPASIVFSYFHGQQVIKASVSHMYPFERKRHLNTWDRTRNRNTFGTDCTCIVSQYAPALGSHSWHRVGAVCMAQTETSRSQQQHGSQHKGTGTIDAGVALSSGHVPLEHNKTTRVDDDKITLSPALYPKPCCPIQREAKHIALSTFHCQPWQPQSSHGYVPRLKANIGYTNPNTNTGGDSP